MILNKTVSSASDVFINDVTLLAVAGNLFPASGSADVNIPLPNALTSLIIRDDFAIRGGVNGVSSLLSYTNTFYAADPASIPEPATFVLMGAGLAGMAALRRRNR